MKTASCVITKSTHVRRDVQFACAIHPQQFRAVTFAEIRILELIAEFHLQPAIGDALVRHAALAVSREFSRADGGGYLPTVPASHSKKVRWHTGSSSTAL